jgi:VanZ family protein
MSYPGTMSALVSPRSLRLAFWAAAVFALVMALLPQPPYVPTQSLGDKVNHIIGFATLAALASLAWPTAPPLRVVERLSFFGAIIEVAQSIPALGRDCEFLDWVADTLAVAVVVGLFTLVRRSNRRRADSGFQ